MEICLVPLILKNNDCDTLFQPYVSIREEQLLLGLRGVESKKEDIRILPYSRTLTKDEILDFEGHLTLGKILFRLPLVRGGIGSSSETLILKKINYFYYFETTDKKYAVSVYPHVCRLMVNRGMSLLEPHLENKDVRSLYEEFKIIKNSELNDSSVNQDRDLHTFSLLERSSVLISQLASENLKNLDSDSFDFRKSMTGK